MKNNRPPLLFLLPFLLCIPDLALAHFGYYSAGTFGEGFLHPFTGFDHSLILLATGMLGARMGKHWNYVYPLTFILFVIGGALWGAMGFPLFWAEIGMLFALFTSLFSVLFSPYLPYTLLLFLNLMCAIFHGHTHATHWLPSFPVGQYWFGFLLATLFLQAIGNLIMHWFSLSFLNRKSLKRFFV